MPIYEYECSKCGQKFELRRGIAESDKEAKCPRCGTEGARRAISAFGIASTGGSCLPSSGG